MSEKTQPAKLPITIEVCSPPSHPTTLGNVWIGKTQLAPVAAAAPTAQPLVVTASDQARDK